ncbi:acetyltransferase domain-containing protein [Biscogniauxia mediterranea]|nr:acetyltransferase domain-containing protein [Biscogniauxia mediterranea]
MAPGPDTRVVTTTLPTIPLPPDTERSMIRTERLIIRPLQHGDAQSLHELRTQPEAMAGTRLGKIDRDIDETREVLASLISSAERSFLFGAFLSSTGEFIGEGGVHSITSDTGWPEIGYKIKREHWGRGYATEFLRSVLDAWWRLPRYTRDVEIHALAVGDAETTEHVYANADIGNVGSQRVLEKLGFKRMRVWTEPDTQLHRLGQPITLMGFTLSRPRY